MATFDDVGRIALALPETSEGSHFGNLSWRVRDKPFVWERPLRPRDLEHLRDRAPAGPVLGARVADEGVKHALVADDPAVYFTTPHFDGYPAVLVVLDAVTVDELAELITEAWLLRAPKRVAKAFLAADQAPSG